MKDFIKRFVITFLALISAFAVLIWWAFAINRLNQTFTSWNQLQAQDLQNMTDKVDELVDNVNSINSRTHRQPTVLSGAISHWWNITSVPWYNWNYSRNWIISSRDCAWNRWNNDYEQAEDHFQTYLSWNTVIAMGRTLNFKHGQWGWWRACSANYLWIWL